MFGHNSGRFHFGTQRDHCVNDWEIKRQAEATSTRGWHLIMYPVGPMGPPRWADVWAACRMEESGVRTDLTVHVILGGFTLQQL